MTASSLSKSLFATLVVVASSALWTVSGVAGKSGGARPAQPADNTDLSTNALSTSKAPTDEEIFFTPGLPEALVTCARPSTPVENQALAAALKQFRSRKERDDYSAILGFLKEHPESTWRVSLLANLGLLYRYGAQFSRALEVWEEAWLLGKNEKGQKIHNLVDLVLGELAELNARLGRSGRLQDLMPDLDSRPVQGKATEKIMGAKEGLWAMKNTPEIAFLCGPYALSQIFATLKPDQRLPGCLIDARSSERGTCLADLLELSKLAGIRTQVARREAGSKFLMPAVVHWKAGHFAAILSETNNVFTIVDPTFSGRSYARKGALEAEASGYFLVPEQTLPAGWSRVSVEEARTVWGRGKCESGDERETRECDIKVGGDQGACEDTGMARYSFHALLASLNIVDTPISYVPPRGPAMQVRLTYNQRDVGLPPNFTFSNLGQKWNAGLIAYVEDQVNGNDWDTRYHPPGGGYETYFTSSQIYTETGPISFYTQLKTRTVLERKSCTPCNPLNTSYELTYPDGSKEIFEKCINLASDANRKFFRTKSIDPFGNFLTYTYLPLGTPARIRLDKVQNQAGHTLTFGYVGTDTKVSTVELDIAGAKRIAKFHYTADSKLSKITDPVGIASEFGYGAGDFISSLTTPYGTTTFSKDPDKGPLADRWLTATDPLGQQEKLTYAVEIPGDLPDNGRPVPSVPDGLTGGGFRVRNTFYWDKKAIQAAGGFNQAQPDYGKARILHWLHSNSQWNPPPQGSVAVAAGILESEKMPLEGRVWYRYPGQGTDTSIIPGNHLTAIARPSVVARVLSDDATTQLELLEYNNLGQVTKYTDPKGRQTTFIYEANGIDLSEIRQTTAGANHFLGRLEYYPGGQHLVKHVFDASGQRTLYEYNSSGQVTKIQNAKNEVTTVEYNATTGFLEKIILPAVAGVAEAKRTLTFMPSPFFQIGTFSDQDGYSVSFTYDALDRVTSITYPDARDVKVVYDKLKPVLFKDREGRWSAAAYNALGQLVAIRDPLDRVTQFDWCSCGSLNSIMDPLGRATFWERDLQGRVTRKIHQDGTANTYLYDTAVNRLVQVTDAKGQKTRLDYDLDENLVSINYVDALIPTAALTFVYDSVVNRLSAYRDRDGETTISYNPFAGSLSAPAITGAGMPRAVDGPLGGDQFDLWPRDELGRVTTRFQNVFGAESFTRDAMGRVTSISRKPSQASTPVASNISYDQGSSRPLQVTFPGSSSELAYFTPGAPDNNLQNQQLLKTIHHKNAGSSTISKFDYNYTALWNILTQTRQRDSNPTDFYTFTYDRGDQMISAEITNGTPAVHGAWAKRWFYTYDGAGNRGSEYIETPGGVMAASAFANNPLNQAKRRYAGERIPVSGPITEVNDLKVVTINGREAKIGGTKPNWTFSGYAVVSADARTFVVTAKDATGNMVTETFEITGNVGATGADKQLFYDLNGNLTTCIEGTTKTTFEWDAGDRMVAIDRMTIDGARLGRSEFSYDAFGRRVRIVEKDGTGSVANDTRYVWSGAQIVSSMNGAGTAVVKSYFADGFAQNGQLYYYTRDHLGSVREIVDSTGAIRARYDYDVYGRVTKLSGDMDSDFGFTGHFWHAPSGLWLAPFRTYDPDLGRWLSRDPIEEAGGLNLYNYVGGDPVNGVDPLGLWNAIMISDRTPRGDVSLWRLNNMSPSTCFRKDISDWEELIRKLEWEQKQVMWNRNEPLETLHISGHGARGGVSTRNANNLVGENLSPSQAARLRKLFGPDAKVKFWGCNSAGSGPARDQLQRLADRLGVPVEGAEGDVAGGADGLFGWSLGKTDPRWYRFSPYEKAPSIGSGSGVTGKGGKP